MKKSIKSTLLAAFLTAYLLPTLATGFDAPDSDPWYYQSDDRGLTFMVPDKAQHYWGSRLLVAAFDRLPLPAKTISSPLLAFVAGLGYEMWQDRCGVGFSVRDLVADALGVAGQRVLPVTTWVEYSTEEKTITLNAALRF